MFFGCEEHKATLANSDNKGRLWEGFQSISWNPKRGEGSKRQEVGSLQGIKEFINLSLESALMWQESNGFPTLCLIIPNGNGRAAERDQVATPRQTPMARWAESHSTGKTCWAHVHAQRNSLSEKGEITTDHADILKLSATIHPPAARTHTCTHAHSSILAVPHSFPLSPFPSSLLSLPLIHTFFPYIPPAKTTHNTWPN